jgi:hypothetical protein
LKERTFWSRKKDMQICESSTTKSSRNAREAMNAYSKTINHSLINKFQEKEDKYDEKLVIIHLGV